MCHLLSCAHLSPVLTSPSEVHLQTRRKAVQHLNTSTLMSSVSPTLTLNLCWVPSADPHYEMALIAGRGICALEGQILRVVSGINKEATLTWHLQAVAGE